MYPRFGMTYVTILTAQARLRAAQAAQPQLKQSPEERMALFSETHNDEVGALWRMGAIIVVAAAAVVAVTAVYWFAS